MSKIAVVKFNQNPKEYYYSAEKLKLAVGDFAIVETQKGLEYAEVFAIISKDDKNFPEKMAKIKAKATEEQIKKIKEFLPKAAEYRLKAIEEVKKLSLDMKIVSLAVSLTEDKILIYFSSENRIEFKDLIKNLAGALKNRVELKQIGQRDACIATGGVGVCGRELCCCGYNKQFPQVTVKMAKSQNITINPQKISGACGRLKCCLSFEVDTYNEILARMPKQGSMVKTQDGREGKVNAIAYLKETVKLKFVDKDNISSFQTFPLSELVFKANKEQSQKEEKSKR